MRKPQGGDIVTHRRPMYILNYNLDPSGFQLCHLDRFEASPAPPGSTHGYSNMAVSMNWALFLVSLILWVYTYIYMYVYLSISLSLSLWALMFASSHIGILANPRRNHMPEGPSMAVVVFDRRQTNMRVPYTEAQSTHYYRTWTLVGASGSTWRCYLSMIRPQELHLQVHQTASIIAKMIWIHVAIGL